VDRIVEKEFSPSVEDAITNVVAERSKADEADNKKARELLRACTTRISRVHRSDLSELHRRIFYSIVETSLTNDITDLSIVRGLMLDLTRSGLLIDKNSNTVWSQDVTDKWQTLTDLLPESTGRRREKVCSHGIIPTSPLPSNIEDLKNITDLKMLL
jgi:hypothetical protein